jgi:hypothetical protein
VRLHHVNVVVPPGATQTVVPFYELLGLVRVPKPGSAPGAWFDVPGGTQLHVSERPGAVHPDAHFAVVVDHFDGVLAQLRTAGRPWEELRAQGGARRGATTDPCGNRVEILEPAGPFAEQERS